MELDIKKILFNGWKDFQYFELRSEFVNDLMK